MFEINKILKEDKNYPTILKKIKDPPSFLYYLGKLPEKKERCFAIVGTRRCSSYGKEMAYEISSRLSEAGLTIVSGFAPGIDTFAHMAAVERGKRTIAVLGTGLNTKSIYPKSNLSLVKKILENDGCLVSELYPENHGTKFSFVKRNRIIAGLSLGVLVIEARIKSGALITADYAFRQKKMVFALPGPINSPLSRGCHFLIKKGAKLVEGAEDVLNGLGLKSFLEKKKISGETSEENLILEVLQNGAQNIEKIIEKTSLPASKVASTISLLEIKGKIKNLGGQIYAISPR